MKPCFSAEILEEYSEVLQRTKFGFSTCDVDALLDLLRKRGELFTGFSVAAVSPDAGDDKFIACAMASRSEFLVTGNKRHFPKSSLHGTRLVSAAELVEHITAGI